MLSANRAHDKPVLAEETLKAILSNVGSLYVLNSGLLNQLEERLANWYCVLYHVMEVILFICRNSVPKIGDIMLNTAPFFKVIAADMEWYE